MMRRALRRLLHEAQLPRLYSSIVRDPVYATVQQSDIDHFIKLLGPKSVLTDDQELLKYNKLSRLQPGESGRCESRDWLGHHQGQSRIALFPDTQEEVSGILKHCHVRRLAIVPQGGNTGLVQGSIPIFDEIILNTARMNKIISFDSSSGTLVCQAGCILESLDQFTTEHGFIVPLDLAAKGSCHIGGNVATNAGGIRLLRYGSLHGSVLGMDVVLANGEMLELMSTLRKDNTGYNLKQLFIGSEGTLGVITTVSIQCAPRSIAQNVCLLAVPDFSTALSVTGLARHRLGEILSALEFMDAESYHLPFEYFSSLVDPLPNSRRSIYLLIETSGSNDGHDKEKLMAFLESALTEGLVTDGVMAQDATQMQNMWKIRECVPQALVRRGSVFKYDLSLPLRAMYHLVEEIRERLAAYDCLVTGFGHLGDANLHLNISTKHPTRQRGILDRIEPYVYQWTAEHNGSISAEHGLGTMKAKEISYSKRPSAVAWMKRMKQLLDPQAILNPYKVLPDN